MKNRTIILSTIIAFFAFNVHTGTASSLAYTQECLDRIMYGGTPNEETGYSEFITNFNNTFAKQLKNLDDVNLLLGSLSSFVYAKFRDGLITYCSDIIPLIAQETMPYSPQSKKTATPGTLEIPLIQLVKSDNTIGGFQVTTPQKISEYKTKESRASRYGLPVQPPYIHSMSYMSIDVPTLLTYVPATMALLVAKTNYDWTAGTVVTKDSQKDNEEPAPWPEECAPHAIWANTDDDTALNEAAQSMADLGTNARFGLPIIGWIGEDEYFLDFHDDDLRVFPGLLLKEKGDGDQEELITFQNFGEAIYVAQELAEKLRISNKCRGFSVYAVSLTDTTDNLIQETNRTASIFSDLGNVTAANATVSAIWKAGKAIKAHTFAKNVSTIKNVTTALSTAGKASKSSLKSAAVGLVLDVVAFGINAYPWEIVENQDKVVILGGPYPL